MKTLKNLKLEGKRVLLRVDFNSPMKGKRIQDDTRIRETLPTIKYILARKPKYLLIVAHQGRPEGKKDMTLSLKPHTRALSKILRKPVKFVPDAMTKKLPKAPIMMMENIRFYHEESKDLKKRNAFAKHLAGFTDVYINDAFACCHRAHASIYNIAKYVKSKGAGFLLAKEIASMKPVLKNPKHPVVLVLGGAKIDTKIGLIKNFKRKADAVLIGGAMANTFLFAEGYEVGQSLYEKDKQKLAQETLQEFGKKMHIPIDVVIADKLSNRTPTKDLPIGDVDFNEKIFDIGKETVKRYCGAIAAAKTIIWNGPMGVTEFTPFQKASKVIAEAIATSKAITILGGGDTIDALNRFHIPFSKFTHVSTGGGAMLEYLEGKKLPGIVALG